MFKKFMAFALICMFTVSCANQQGGEPMISKQNIGALGGAVIGGVLGSQVGGGSGQLWATGAGAVLGGLVGSEIGKSLDKADRMYLNRAAEQAQTAPVGRSISWNNPDSGNRGTVTPVRDGRDGSNNYCREYETTVYIDGRAETGTGTACKQADGRWSIVNN